MNKVVVFGVMDFAELAHFYLTHDSDYEVVAFTVNEEYLPEDRKFHGLPVVPFEEVEQLYPPADYLFFAPMSNRRMNSLREKIYNEAKQKGYQLISYISSKAIVFPETPIGDNCFILEQNTIQPFTSIGNNVVMWSGNHLGHHSTVMDHVFFTSQVGVSGHCTIESFCFLGGKAGLLQNVRVAEGTFVAAWAFIDRDTEPWFLYKGNPARKTRISSRDIDY